MKIHGKQARDIAALVFNITVLVALPCHAIESMWFWGAISILLWLSFLTIIGLEVLRLVAPDFADNWWDQESR